MNTLPPQNLEAERGAIGSVLQDWSVMGDVAEAVAAADFYRDTHETVFAELYGVHAEGGACDGLILADRLASKPGRNGGTLLDDVGGVEALADLQNSVPHAANGVYYGQIVRQKALARRVLEAARETEREALSNALSGDGLVESFERRAYALADVGAAGETVDAARMMAEVREHVARRRRGELVGLGTGLGDLDAMTCGFRAGNLVYVAGRTSMGKTALALNVIEHNAVNFGVPVLFVSLEMNRVEIGERLAVARSGVSGHKIQSGYASDHEYRRFHDATEQVGAAPLFIDDTPGRTAVQIAANARRHRSRHGIELLVVDLINHVEGDDPKQNRREQMTLISRRLKGIARELSIPVVCLAQLNRGPDQREGNRPRKSDLKECGGLEEDAHLVILLHRPEYYDPNDQPGVANVIVDKNRNGPTGDIRAVFRREVMRFESFHPDAPAPLDAPVF